MRREADGLSALARESGHIRRNQPVSGPAAPISSGKRSILRIATAWGVIASSGTSVWPIQQTYARRICVATQGCNAFRNSRQAAHFFWDQNRDRHRGMPAAAQPLDENTEDTRAASYIGKSGPGAIIDVFVTCPTVIRDKM